MAHDRHQQPKKSYRQKGRAAKSAPNARGGAQLGSNDFVLPPTSPAVTLACSHSTDIHSFEPQIDSAEYPSKTLEAMDALVTSLCSDINEAVADDSVTDAIEPDAIEPDAIEPDAIEPDAIEPEAIEPDAAVADVAVADVALTDVAEADVAVADVAVADVDVAEVVVSDVVVSDVAVADADPLRDSGYAWSLAIDSKLNELMERSKIFERERLEIESLREHLKQAIDTAESRLVSSGSDTGIARLEELESQLIATQRENTKVSTMLLHARAEYQSLLAFIESEANEAGHAEDEMTTIAQRVLEKTDARELELSLEVSQLNDQLQFLKSELDDAKSAPSNRTSDESELRLQIEQLRSQLLEARNEAIELRIQSNDLGSKLAKHGPVGNRSETLTWEQRKEALLQQLEAENHSDTPRDPDKALEIEHILEQTTVEIERRDEEIADLKALIEQQSIARDGMSIGVSAIAEMIESDALIVAERLRLKELRDEWEQKQRQAEIEMSMERAKLARERLEIQEKTQQYSDNNPPQTEEERKSGKTRTRGRWLARLGLRDE